MMHEPAFPPHHCHHPHRNNKVPKHERFLSSHSPPRGAAQLKAPQLPPALRELMEQRRTDAEGGQWGQGGQGGHGVRSAGKLAVVIAVQNLLVLACLLGLFYIYMELPTMPEDIVHIKFNYLNLDSSGNPTVHFQNPERSHGMKPLNETIHVECTGPYVWYIENCEIKKENNETSGILQLRVQGSDTPVSSFTLNTTKDCRGLHSITYLRAGERASVHLYSEGFAIYDMSMGLIYLLGNKCDF